MSLHERWTRHLEGNDKDKFRSLLVADTVVLNRLYAILEEFEAELIDKDLQIKEYESPAFPYLKADRNGERRMLLKIKQLLSFLKE